MHKFAKPISIFVLLVLLLCSCRFSDSIYMNWGINLSNEYKTKYSLSYPEDNARGDGIFFTVKSCDESILYSDIGLTVEWNDVDENVFNEFSSIIKPLNIDKEYEISTYTNCKYFYLIGATANDFVYFIFDQETSLLFIIEHHL